MSFIIAPLGSYLEVKNILTLKMFTQEIDTIVYGLNIKENLKTLIL